MSVIVMRVSVPIGRAGGLLFIQELPSLFKLRAQSTHLKARHKISQGQGIDLVVLVERKRKYWEAGRVNGVHC